MKVAITADWINSFGGAERVLIELHRMFPDAPIYTTVYAPDRLPPQMHGWDVRPSFLQKLPFAARRHQPFLPLMPLAFEQFDLSGYDVVLSTNSACAKGVITPPGVPNVCYCYTPCRYIWDLYHEYTRGHSKIARAGFSVVAHYLRMWDRVAADRVDHFVAISREVASRIGKHYRRDAEVIYPPVNTESLRPNGRDPEDFYLVVSRLVPYKRVDLAVRAATRLGKRLIVVGRGPEAGRLRAMAGPTVQFTGWLPDDEILNLYTRCRALIFPGFEDFGITPVEAQAAGRPVVALGRGGVLETVVDGVTGVLFERPQVEDLAAAILRLEELHLDPSACRRSAERFAAHEFRRRIRRVLEDAVNHTAGSTRANLALDAVG